MGNTNTHPANKPVSTYCTLQLPETAPEGEKLFVFGKAVTSFFTLKETLKISLQYLSKELKGHPWVVENEVLTNGYCLRYASPELRAEKSIVTTAVISCVNAIEFAAPHLKQDIPFIVHLIESIGQQNLYFLVQTLQDTLPDLLLNPRILTAIALKCSDRGHAGGGDAPCNRVFTLFCKPHYAQMKPVVLREAIKHNSIFPRLRPSHQSEYWQVAMGHNLCQGRHMHAGLKDDDEVAKFLVARDGSTFSYLSPCIRADEGILSTAMLTCPDVLRDAPATLQTYDKKMYAISKKSTLIRVFPEMLRDPVAVLCAVRQKPFLLLFASTEIQADRKVVVAAILRQGELFASLLPSMRTPKLEALAEKTRTVRNLLGRVEFIEQSINSTDAFSTFLLSAHYFSQADEETTKKRLISTNTLQMLNQHGPHFARILKMKIASYVGVYFDIMGDLRLALEDARK